MLGRTELPSDGGYTIEYEALPNRRIDLVVRAVTGRSTLAESGPIRDVGVEETVSLTVPAEQIPVSDVAQGNDLFDFMMIRPADTSSSDAVRTDDVVGETGFVSELTTARADGDRAAMTEAALDYMASGEFVRGLEAGSESLASFGERLAATPSPTTSDVRTAIEETFGATPAAVADDPEFRRLAARLADSLAASSVAPGADGAMRRELARGVRLTALVDRIADDGVEDVAQLLERPVSLPDGLFPLPPLSTPRTPDGRPERPADGVSDDAASLYEELESVRTAKAELVSAELATPRPPSSAAVTGGDSRSAPVDQEAVERPEDVDEYAGDAPTDVDTAIDRLTEAETRLGAEFLRTTLEPISGRTARIGNSFRTVPPGEEAASEGDGVLDSWAALPDWSSGTPFLPGGLPDDFPDGLLTPPSRADTGLVNVLGVGEMRTVKRETAGYEMGELAHVENVLEGERKERVHEREEVTQETLITETETTETQKRDLQTSEQFEMVRESQETIKQKSSIEAGVKVSASYGPTVQVDAYTDYSRSQARERSEQASRRYSREVTKQTVNRIQRRKFRREVEKRKQRVTETNTHELNNKGDDENVTGIYRWVDKILRAQVFEHGRRLMLEFVVPEPAAFYRQATASNPADQIMMQKPEPPRYASIDRSNGTVERTVRPLEPRDLGNWNYQHYASRYGATDISPPPKAVVKRGTKVQKPGTVPQKNKKPIYKSGTVTIPEGYEAARASVGFSDVVRNKRNWRWKLQATVGDQPVSVGWRGTWGVGGLSRASNDNIVEDLVDAVDANTRFPIPHDPAESELRKAIQNTTGVSLGAQQGGITEDTFTYENQLGMSEKQRPIALDSRKGITPQSVPLPSISSESADGSQTGVPVTVFAYNLLGFGVTITVTCRRTQEHYEEWQIETYKQIRTAFENELAEYRKKLAEARAEEGVQIEGNAPEENRRIEREELKRLAISMMRETHVDIDAVEDITDDDATIPGVDFSALKSASDVIQFCEQAFEWTDMTYVFYPYFWTDRDDWAELEQYEATDPAFESFLSAGAARVVVPVRPGFFDSVLWFLQSQEIDFDPPDIGDERYVPIVSEIKEQQGVDEDAEPTDDPWAVRVPTELVKLQQSETLPDLPPDIDGS